MSDPVHLPLRGADEPRWYSMARRALEAEEAEARRRAGLRAGGGGRDGGGGANGSRPS